MNECISFAFIYFIDLPLYKTSRALKKFFIGNLKDILSKFLYINNYRTLKTFKLKVFNFPRKSLEMDYLSTLIVNKFIKNRFKEEIFFLEDI